MGFWRTYLRMIGIAAGMLLIVAILLGVGAGIAALAMDGYPITAFGLLVLIVIGYLAIGAQRLSRDSKS